MMRTVEQKVFYAFSASPVVTDATQIYYISNECREDKDVTHRVDNKLIGFVERLKQF